MHSYISDSTLLYCRLQSTLTDKIFQFISTGFIASFLAFLSLDLGVIYANFLKGWLEKRKGDKKQGNI